ncbi:spinster family MFS transporter [Erythrobacter aurantius]|uniref:spinster family MFS transporter n=1 Tax=Erythrobacter aurantius TaxID=2909249 RepID=UPI00207AE2F9|nr:MFS transporter [Erythrobacter aurantius]
MNQTDPAARPALPNKWIVLILLLGIAIFNHADRFLLAGLVDPIKAEFGVSDGFMGLLMGPAFAVFYSTLAIPIAIYADRANRIRIIVAGCVIWSVFTILSGYATGPATLAAARIGVGVGEAAFQAPAYSVIAAYFMADQRGKAFAVMALAVYFGQMLGYGAGPAIAEVHDWRFAFKLFGAIGLAIVAVAWLIVREPPRTEAATARLPFVPLARQLVRLRSYRGMMFGMGIGVLSGIAFGFWGPTLFSRNYGISMAEAGSAFGGAFVIPGMIGAMLFGALADRIAKNGYARMLVLSAIGLAVATGVVVATVWAQSLTVALLWALPAGLFGGGWAVGIYAGLQYVLPDRMRATGTAIAMLAVNLLGYVIGPWLAGVLSEAFGEGAQGLRMALTVVVPVGLLGALLLWRGALSLEADRKSLHEEQTN